MAPDPADMQGLVRLPYRYQLSRHLLFKIDDAAGAKRMIGALLPRVATGADLLRLKNEATDRAGDGEPLFNLGLTWAGLLALDAVTASGTDFPDAFTNPVFDGDWAGRVADSDIHLAVHIHCRSDDVLDRASAEVRQLATPGLTELKPANTADGAVSGRALGGALMHFGILDGFSEPAVDWDDARTDPDTVDLRHFLLGYANDSFDNYPRTEPWGTLVRNGTYGVLQVVRQDSAAFEAYLDDNAPAMSALLPGANAADPETLAQARSLLKAKMFGRWDDGTPVELSPDRPDPTVSRTDFGYATDPSGLRCPLHAHIRLANRRDQRLTDLVSASFPNGGPHLLRRGLPYGPPFAGGPVDDKVDRGVVGLFLCADILRQYRTVQAWMNKADFSTDFNPRRLHLQDMMMADRSFQGADTNAFIPFLQDGDPAKARELRLKSLPSFVEVVGTTFLLIPGLSGLRSIVGTA